MSWGLNAPIVEGVQSGVLFVDDDLMTRQMYGLLSKRLESLYEISIAASGAEGVEMLQRRKFEVVVTDLSMPGMDGREFLKRVVEKQPDCARIVVSGYGERLQIAEYLFTGHRYFDKPCDFPLLFEFLIRLASFRELITNEKVRRMVGGVGSLPGPPERFLRLEKLLKSPFTGVEEVAAVVEEDLAVTAKLLQIVNSASFGLDHKVLSAVEAVQLLGVQSLQALVLGLQAFTMYNGKPGKKGPPAELWEHSLRVGIGARSLAKGRGLSQESCDRAFLAGLLHDVGGIVIHCNAPEEQGIVRATAKRFGLSARDAEWQRFGATSAEIGAYLLALWGIDEEVVMMVQYHASPSAFPGKETMALAALHAAHTMEVNDAVLFPMDLEVLRDCGFSELRRAG